jgi:hypothetical protein
MRSVDLQKITLRMNGEGRTCLYFGASNATIRMQSGPLIVETLSQADLLRQFPVDVLADAETRTRRARLDSAGHQYVLHAALAGASAMAVNLLYDIHTPDLTLLRQVEERIAPKPAKDPL